MGISWMGAKLCMEQSMGNLGKIFIYEVINKLIDYMRIDGNEEVKGSEQKYSRGTLFRYKFESYELFVQTNM